MYTKKDIEKMTYLEKKAEEIEPKIKSWEHDNEYYHLLWAKYDSPALGRVVSINVKDNTIRTDNGNIIYADGL